MNVVVERTIEIVGVTVSPTIVRVDMGNVGPLGPTGIPGTALAAASTKAGLGTPTAGEIRRVTDSVRGLWFADGSRWNSIAGEVVNVKEFGAVGDGITDDTAAIQAAVAAGSVLFPAGTYSASPTTFSGLTGRRLLGMGPQSIVKRRGASPGAWTFEDCHQITIEGLAFDMNGVSAFGGVSFLRSSQIRIVNNRFYDSNKQAVGASDRYGLAFRVDVATPHSEIWVQNNLFEDLQLEVDCARKVWIQNNMSYRSVRTAGIAVVTIANGSVAEDYDISGNIIVDSHGSGIAVNLDPASSSSCTLRRIAVHDNKIIRTAANPAAGRGVLVGTPSSGTATTGNVFSEIDVYDNLLWFDSTLTSMLTAIGFLSAATPAFVFNRCRVEANRVVGNGATFSENAFEIKFLKKGRVSGNDVRGVTYGLALGPDCENSLFTNNVVEATSVAYTLNDGGTAGNNRFEHNDALGSPSTPYSFVNAVNTTFKQKKRFTHSAGTLSFGTVAANASSSLDVTVTGVVVGDHVSAAPNGEVGGELGIKAFVFTANTVRIRLLNVTTSSIVSVDRQWIIAVEQFG